MREVFSHVQGGRFFFLREEEGFSLFEEGGFLTSTTESFFVQIGRFFYLRREVFLFPKKGCIFVVQGGSFFVPCRGRVFFVV